MNKVEVEKNKKEQAEKDKKDSKRNKTTYNRHHSREARIGCLVRPIYARFERLELEECAWRPQLLSLVSCGSIQSGESRSSCLFP
jgi:hypothetical protein